MIVRMLINVMVYTYCEVGKHDEGADAHRMWFTSWLKAFCTNMIRHLVDPVGFPMLEYGKNIVAELILWQWSKKAPEVGPDIADKKQSSFWERQLRKL